MSRRRLITYVNDLQEKNVSFDSLEGKVGRVYMPKQDLNSMALNKMKVSHQASDLMMLLTLRAYSRWITKGGVCSNMPQNITCYVCSGQFWSITLLAWATLHSTRLLVKLTPKGVVFTFLFFSACLGMVCSVLMKPKRAICTMRY